MNIKKQFLTDKQYKRDESIDLLKGIAIILVVYGHTWPFCRNFIYLFHISVFLMASGYCYRARIRSFSSWEKYMIRKAKGLYIPFIICNGIFVLLSNVFLRVGIYSSSPELLAISRSWPVKQTLVQPLELILLAKKLTAVFLFYGATQLGTATWFLTSLFEVLSFNSLVELVTSRNRCKFRRIVLLAVSGCMLVLCQYISDNDMISVKYAIKCFPVCYISFMLGRLVKNIRWKYFYSWQSGFLAFITLCIFSLYFHIEVSAGKVENVLIFFITSLCGWICLRTFSSFILKARLVTSKIFQYIGRHTMSILCLHVLSFETISLLYIFCMKKTIVYLAAWHIIFDINEVWKLLYMMAGVVIPIILYRLYSIIETRTITINH